MLDNKFDQEKITLMLKQHGEFVKEIVVTDNVSEAKKVLGVINLLLENNKDLRVEHQDLFDGYQLYSIMLKYVVIYELDVDEIADLLKNHLDFALDNLDVYNLDKKIRYKMRDIIGFEARDSFKARLRETLLSCNIKISERIVNINGKKLDMRVSSWLKSYGIAVGIDRADVLKISEYLSKDPNIKALLEQELAKLKMIFHFFENLKVSSKEFPLFEESFIAITPDSEIAVIADDKIEKIDDGVVTLAEEMKRIVRASSVSDDVLMVGKKDGSISQEFIDVLSDYSPSSLEYKAIKQEIERLRKNQKDV